MHVAGLQRILDCESVHDRGQHAHMVARHAVHAGSGKASAAKDVTAPDDHGNLGATIARLGDLGGDTLNDAGFDAVIEIAHEYLATEF